MTTETTPQQTTKATTPLMAQYLEVKGRYPDALLFFRMGDFYELFFEDAVTVSRICDIALTSRNKNDPNPVPMCGFPHHSGTPYINKLVAAGHKVAICEQLEDPAVAKGIVKRDVIKVVTPGTQFDPEALDAKSLNLTHAVWPVRDRIVFASCDFTTGYFTFGCFASREAWLTYLRSYPVAEIILPEDEAQASSLEDGIGEHIYVQRVPEFYFDTAYATQCVYAQFETESLKSVHQKLEDDTDFTRVAGALVKHFQVTQLGKPRIPLAHRIDYWAADDAIDLDPATLAALDIFPRLFELLDLTRTSVGGRLLRQRLLRPLKNRQAIERRLQDVRWFFERSALREELATKLSGIYDLERIMARVGLGSANARDLRNLAQSVGFASDIARALHKQQSPLAQDLTTALSADIVQLGEDAARMIVEQPPVATREGGLFNRGVDPRLDELIDLTEKGTQWLADFELREKEATKIASLKVRFNKVFGYYIEITKSNLGNVPAHYVRKQTTAGGERFITEELKNFEEKITSAEKKRQDLELALFQELCVRFTRANRGFSELATAIARVDVSIALATRASDSGYVEPTITDDASIEIIEGRHPIVEVRGGFVPNTVKLGGVQPRFLLITGPNMGGKSTVMRQTAVIVLLAQAGSFVPAESARIGLCDRIFSRVGASDNLAAGQSTFMVEMSEMSYILRNATPKSLIILDEVGRGTSTFDGLSLAWALAEEILENIRARTLFATHYHELTDLATQHPAAANARVGVECDADHNVRFLYKLEPGAAERSYGISVAKLAGVPARVLTRAQSILGKLESRQSARVAKAQPKATDAPQLGLGL